MSELTQQQRESLRLPVAVVTACDSVPIEQRAAVIDDILHEGVSSVADELNKQGRAFEGMTGLAWNLATKVAAAEGTTTLEVLQRYGRLAAEDT